jgi:hypothetical protein
MGIVQSAFVAVFLLISTTVLSEIRDPGEHFFHSTFGDFSEELEIAREEGKKGGLSLL